MRFSAAAAGPWSAAIGVVVVLYIYQNNKRGVEAYLVLIVLLLIVTSLGEQKNCTRLQYNKRAALLLLCYDPVLV